MEATAPRARGLDDDLDGKLTALLEALREPVAGGAVVAFSGGVDSAALLWAAVEARRRWGGRVLALTTTSAATPAEDLADAAAVAGRLGVEHLLRPSGELELPAYRRNDSERCYHCKTELFRLAREVARERGLAAVLYGYNASDRADVRPGHRAALEAGALSPLAAAGLAKEDVRALLRHAGLEIADKAASPCLASRLQTGVVVTAAALSDVAALEAVLRRAGIRGGRARLCDAGAARFARIEVPPEAMARAVEAREELLAVGAERGLRWVTLDLAGYRTGGATA